MIEDYTTLTDEEFSQVQKKVEAERQRRANLTDIPQRIAKLSNDYLEAEGTDVGESWRQPAGAHDAYPKGWQISHNGTVWQSTTPSNVWEPGVTGWREVSASSTPSTWEQPLGAHDAYALGADVIHNGTRWRSTIKNNVWEPGVFHWAPIPDGAVDVAPDWVLPTDSESAYTTGDMVLHDGLVWVSAITNNTKEPGTGGWTVIETPPAPEPEPTVEAWVQPTGAHDDYDAGAKVAHNGSTWISDQDGNVWEPGVFGWTEETTPIGGGTEFTYGGGQPVR